MTIFKLKDELFNLYQFRPNVGLLRILALLIKVGNFCSKSISKNL